MLLEKIIKTHPTVVCAQDLNAICQPLKDYLNISYFCHVNMTKNKISALGLYPQFAEHYFIKKYFNVDSHLSKIQLQEEYIIQDIVEHSGLTQQLFKDCYDFGLYHVFTIVQRNDTCTDAFHFATSSPDSTINGKYLNNLTFLKNFILHFKEKVFSDKKLAQAYQYQIPLATNACYEIEELLQQQTKNNSTPFNFNLNKFFLSSLATQKYLTKREVDCIFCLYQGKTFEEIGGLLGITERTVRAHINHIKDKFECHTLFQLGEKISKTDLTAFFHKNQ